MKKNMEKQAPKREKKVEKSSSYDPEIIIVPETVLKKIYWYALLRAQEITQKYK